MIELAGYLACEFNMCNLVCADRDELRLVEQDVGGLEERITEEAVGSQILLAQLLLLILVAGDAFQPAKRSEHAEQQMQLGVLGNVRLDKDRALSGIQSRCQKVDSDIEDALFQTAGVGVVGGQGVEVGDEEVAVVVLLQVHPVVEGAHVVAEVQSAGGAHAGENTGARRGT